jgi:hypothetical protein
MYINLPVTFLLSHHSCLNSCMDRRVTKYTRIRARMLPWHVAPRQQAIAGIVPCLFCAPFHLGASHQFVYPCQERRTKPTCCHGGGARGSIQIPGWQKLEKADANQHVLSSKAVRGGGAMAFCYHECSARVGIYYLQRFSCR